MEAFLSPIPGLSSPGFALLEMICECVYRSGIQEHQRLWMYYGNLSLIPHTERDYSLSLFHTFNCLHYEKIGWSVIHRNLIISWISFVISLTLKQPQAEGQITRRCACAMKEEFFILDF